METTKLSSKGQVIIPKTLRAAHHWHTGLELMVIDTGDGVILKPKAPFEPTALADVAGMLRTRVVARTDEEIQAALTSDIRSTWRGGN
jgi:AbrB family looped-hinge helix DNA binding protein